jgi:hypothetical protein
VIHRLLTLIGATLAFWVLLALPARWAWGEATLVYSGVAMALCLVPAAVSLAWAAWAYRLPADKQLTMVLGGTGLRLFLVVGGAYALTASVPYFRMDQTPGFWTWVAVFYLFTLALETALSLAGRPAAEGSSLPAGPGAPAERLG